MFVLMSVAAAGAPTHVSVGYLGEALAHPGVKLSLEREYQASGLVLGADVGGYHHPRSHLGLYTDVRAGWRHRGAGGYIFGVHGGVGYLHSLITVETANFDTRGHPGVMPLVELEPIGWALEPRGHSVELISSIRVFGQYPVNTHMVWHPAMGVSLRWGL